MTTIDLKNVSAADLEAALKTKKKKNANRLLINEPLMKA